MNLKEGIRIYNQQIENIEGQISINSGVLPVDNTNPEIQYYHNAYLPNLEWRSLTDPEYKKILTPDEDSRMFNTLGMGTVPLSLEKLFKSLKLNECESLFDVPKQFEKNEDLIKKLNDELNVFLEQKSSGGKYKFHRIARSLPDMQSTTFHHTGQNTFKYTGLHIDKSISFTPHTAYKSDNRISINISAESRFLYFINLTLRQIYTKVQKKYTGKITSENIVEEFFKLYPDYPVVRLEIKPYQYYIAPTDNFIHDGTTLGNKFFDITMVYTGVFDRY